MSLEEYVDYETEQMKYMRREYIGCRSKNFLPENWQMITLERLFQSNYGESLCKKIFSLEDGGKRLEFLVNYVVRMTGLKDFGIYMSKLMTIDALFLNEDRHTHNIAVLLDTEGKYHYCPIFDNGAGLMADTSLDYPMDVPVQELFGTVSAKTFCLDFDEQLDSAEQLYGQQVKFCYSRKDIVELLKQEKYYPENVKNRVCDILTEQRRKYQYLFVKKSKKQSDFLSRNNMDIDHKNCTFLRTAKKCNFFMLIYTNFFATIFNPLANILNFFQLFLML